MALSSPRTVFGIHSVTLRNHSTKVPYGTALMAGGATFSLAGELVENFSGSSNYAWDVQNGTINSEIAFTFDEYPNFGFEAFLGKALTENSAEASGNVTTLTNANGTLLEATTGIASIAALSGSEANLKMGLYTAVAIDATTINIFADSNIDFARGTDTTFNGDNLAINAAPITIVDSGATVAVSNYGLEITSGSGTVAMVAGESATFEVRPINTSSVQAVFGGSSDTYPNFEAILYAESQSNGRFFRIHVYKAKAIGMPFGLTKKEFSSAEVTAKAFYDATRGGVFGIEEVII